VVGAVAVGAAGYAALLAVLVPLGLLLTGPLEGSLGAADLDVNRWFVEHRTPALDTLTSWGSGLANTPVVILVGSLVASVLLIKRWAQGTVALAAALFTEVSVFLTTVVLVPRDRPDVPKLDQVPPTSSFPSGHTAASIALYGMLAVIACALVRTRFLQWVAIAVGALVPVAVGFSRMYRGMHHPSDVVAGVLLGLGALLVGVLAARVALLLARARSGGAPAGVAGSRQLAMNAGEARRHAEGYSG
jgi:undecaprenyl-diphosphatase